MKVLLVFPVLFSLVGCLPEENCHETDRVINERVETTEFYTIIVPVYETVCE